MNILTASRLFTFVRKGTMYEISTACFIYRSIFAVQALRKRRVQGHCAAYHFRISTTRRICPKYGEIQTGMYFYLPPGSPEGDYNLHHVRVYVRACVFLFTHLN